VRYIDPEGRTRLGRFVDDHVIDAAPADSVGFDARPESWSLIENARGMQFGVDEIRLLAPTNPGKVLCVGSNYRDHIEETGVQQPQYPIIFVKLSSAIIGPGEDIVLPYDEPQPDWEAELALVIGRRTRRATGAQALAAVGGLTAFNDVSGRYGQLTTGLGQYTRGKSFDTFGPLGPAVVHPEDLDGAALDIGLVLNGETMQQSNTKHLLFDAQALIEWVSAASTLFPGDVIATGTPGGVGIALDPPRYLADGDVVDVVIEGIGTLRNPVRAEPAPTMAGGVASK